jgi:hypothetical protein
VKNKGGTMGIEGKVEKYNIARFKEVQKQRNELFAEIVPEMIEIITKNPEKIFLFEEEEGDYRIIEHKEKLSINKVNTIIKGPTYNVGKIVLEGEMLLVDENGFMKIVNSIRFDLEKGGNEIFVKIIKLNELEETLEKFSHITETKQKEKKKRFCFF